MDSSIENSKPDKELYHKAETKAESHLLNSLSTIQVNLDPASERSWQTFLYDPKNPETFPRVK